MVKKISLIFITLLITCSLFAFERGLPVQFSSPRPEAGDPTLVPLPKLKNKAPIKLKVLVFPHTLKEDYRHGQPDDPFSVILESSHPFEVKGDGGVFFISKRIFLKSTGDEIIIHADGSDFFEAGKLSLAGSAPIKVIRSKNLDKSHSYLGRFEIIRKNSELRLINEVELEDYLRGVVPSEAIPSWPLNALKAQAVAARTYAIYHFQRFHLSATKGEWHVDDTARFQVYTGLSHVTNATDLAILESVGEIMTYKNKVIIAYFHSYSGGRTDSALNIFNQRNVPYSLGKDEVFSRDELRSELANNSHWIIDWTTDLFSKKELLIKFKKNRNLKKKFENFIIGKELSLLVKDINSRYGSVKNIEAIQGEQKASVHFRQLRKSIGWSKFPSYHFSMIEKDNGYRFRGHGWGHHVGMSQWGAYMMAKKFNQSYTQILHHYYSGIRIVSLQKKELL